MNIFYKKLKAFFIAKGNIIYSNGALVYRKNEQVYFLITMSIINSNFINHINSWVEGDRRSDKICFEY